MRERFRREILRYHYGTRATVSKPFRLNFREVVRKKNQRTEFRRGLLPEESFRRHFLKLSVEKSSWTVIEKEILGLTNEKKLTVVRRLWWPGKKMGFSTVCSHFDGYDLIDPIYPCLTLLLVLRMKLLCTKRYLSMTTVIVGAWTVNHCVTSESSPCNNIVREKPFRIIWFKYCFRSQSESFGFERLNGIHVFD
jgi:hypothetical protein